MTRLQPPLPPPSGLRASSFRLGGDEYVVLSFPSRSPGLPETLTATESSVARSVLAGLTNRQIASKRGVAVRTVANQVASILKKAGVATRHELMRKHLT